MKPPTTVPTLLTRPATACPRCDDSRVVPLAVDSESSFAWYECEACKYLWALPQAGLEKATSLHVRSRQGSGSTESPGGRR